MVQAVGRSVGHGRGGDLEMSHLLPPVVPGPQHGRHVAMLDGVFKPVFAGVDDAIADGHQSLVAEVPRDAGADHDDDDRQMDHHEADVLRLVGPTPEEVSKVFPENPKELVEDYVKRVLRRRVQPLKNTVQVVRVFAPHPIANKKHAE